MKNSVKIKRYLLILNYFIENKKPTFEQIHKYIQSYDLEISQRTLQRDLSDLKNEFGIEIVFDKAGNCYSINYDESGNIDEILRLLKISNSAQVMINTINDGKSAMKYLALDSSENLTGIELMEPLLTALKTKQVITFNHFNFQTKEKKLITLHPYLLKEYQNRWFLYGYNVDTKIFFLYGIERISNLILTGNYFVPEAGYDPKKAFNKIIGVTLRSFEGDYPVQKFVLSMTEEQGRYFKTLPWHPDYSVLIDTKNEFRVELHLLPNYEFMQMLYKYCDKVTVLEPQWLRDWLKEKFKTSSEKY